MLQKRTPQVFAQPSGIFFMRQLLLKHIQLLLSGKWSKKIFITSHQPVFGGDINACFLINSNEGRWFVKLNGAEGIDMFEKEYNGLTFLRNKTTLKIPEPLLSGVFENNSFLVMEHLQKETHTPQSWQSAGIGLADLHRQTQLQYGFAEDNYIGNLPQQNHLTGSWPEFYASQRILPLFQKALQKNFCTAEDRKAAELICRKLSDYFPQEPPALLHGDLWSGNMMACANGEVAIYDPAIYYGHREMDIAMTLMFGGFDSLFYEYYNEAYPLQTGWQQRVELCQLYPLLVHLNLFGSGYYGRIKSILNKYK